MTYNCIACDRLKASESLYAHAIETKCKHALTRLFDIGFFSQEEYDELVKKYEKNDSTRI